MRPLLPETLAINSPPIIARNRRRLELAKFTAAIANIELNWSGRRFRVSSSSEKRSNSTQILNRQYGCEKGSAVSRFERSTWTDC